MARRLGWSKLKPATRKRYTSNGITRQLYEQGANLQKARGHATTPEHGGPNYASRALADNIELVWPDFRSLPIREQNRIGRFYVEGMFTKGTGSKLTTAERIKRGIHPKDKNNYRHAGDREIDARQDFMQAFREYQHNFDESDWANYREAYRETYSSVA